MIPRRPPFSLDDRDVTRVLIGCLFVTIAVIAIGVFLGGCSPPVAIVRSPSTCTTAPAFVSDSFCAADPGPGGQYEPLYAGTSPCVLCFAAVGTMPRDPIYGCVLPNNQYCVNEAGCGDPRCTRVFARRVRDGGVSQ